MRNIVIVASLLVSLSLCAAEAQENGAKKELDALQGTWQRIGAEVKGQRIPGEVLRRTILTITGDKYLLRTGEEKRSGTIKLDATRTPKHIEIIADAGPNKGKSLLGIYEIEGEIFRYCVAAPGQDRPTEFVSKTGSDVGLYVNKRVTPDRIDE